MNNFEKPMVDIVLFNAQDIVTTSFEGDNGFIDIGDLLKKIFT